MGTFSGGDLSEMGPHQWRGSLYYGANIKCFYVGRGRKRTTVLQVLLIPVTIISIMSLNRSNGTLQIEYKH